MSPVRKGHQRSLAVNNQEDLVDFEAFGSLAVTGEPLAVDNTVRALVTEMGASEDLANVNVITVDVDLGLPSALDRIRSLAGPSAVGEVRSVRHQHQAMIDETGTQDSFGLRVRSGVGPEALVVVVSADDPHVNELLEIAQPRCGVVVLMLGACPGAVASFETNNTGGAELLPLGLRVTPASMPASTAEALAAALSAVPTLANEAHDDDSVDAVEDDEVWLAVFGEPVEEPDADEAVHESDSEPAPDPCRVSGVRC